MGALSLELAQNLESGEIVERLEGWASFRRIPTPVR